MSSAKSPKRWEECAAKKGGKTPLGGAVGTDLLVVAQESREVDGKEQERWAQLKDKPLVTGLA